LDDLKRNTHGAVFDTITSATFHSIKTLLPCKKVLRSFEKIVAPIFDEFENHARENQELTNLRDTLLPKLISGELELSELKN
jgi:type I restriction enzyme, S subunit